MKRPVGSEFGAARPDAAWRIVVVAVLTVFSVSARLAAAVDGPPNVVVILADDLGWGSVSAYGADADLIRTPNIDRIAAEGVLFRDANTPSSVCSPTRYSLLTGRYAWRTRLKAGTLGLASPLLLEEDRPTIASLLQSVGYRTAIIGKWHLGFGEQRRVDYRLPLEPGPLERGFDYFFGLGGGHGDTIGAYIENRSVVGLRSGNLLPRQRRGENFKGQRFIGLDAPHRADDLVMKVLTDRAAEWLRKQSVGQPFFLLFSAAAVHQPISPSKTWQGTSAAGPYGDWIHQLDGSVGRILAALEDEGLSDNTLVIFTSDNGGVVSRNNKLAVTQAVDKGLRINGPYRDGKRSIFEGGFRVPFVARWPGSIPPATVRAETVNLVDLYATIAAAAGIGSAATVAAADSVSFLSALLSDGPTDAQRASMILHAQDGNFAIRWGAWKWIEGEPHRGRKRDAYRDRPEEHHSQLYNLDSDPSEERNVEGEYPEIARLMSRLLERHRDAEGYHHVTLGEP